MSPQADMSVKRKEDFIWVRRVIQIYPNTRCVGKGRLSNQRCSSYIIHRSQRKGKDTDSWTEPTKEVLGNQKFQNYQHNSNNKLFVSLIDPV